MKFFPNPDEPLKLTVAERIGGWISFAVCNLQLTGVLLLLIFNAVGVKAELYTLNVAIFISNAVIVAAVFHRTMIKGVRVLMDRPGRFFATAGIALGVYVAAMEVVSLLMTLAPAEVTNANNDLVTAMILEHPVVMTISTVILAPLAEECFWRALVYGEVRQLNRPLAYAASTLLFALLHVWQFIGEYSALNLVLVTISYLPAGIVLAWTYDRSKSIWCPILVHATINATVCVFTFLGV